MSIDKMSGGDSLAFIFSCDVRQMNCMSHTLTPSPPPPRPAPKRPVVGLVCGNEGTSHQDCYYLL